MLVKGGPRVHYTNKSKQRITVNDQLLPTCIISHICHIISYQVPDRMMYGESRCFTVLFCTLIPGKMVQIVRWTFSNAILCMRIFLLWFNTRWTLVITLQYLLKSWRSAEKTTSHYLDQPWGYGYHNGKWYNALWPSDLRRRQVSGSTLAPVMACCLHYLTQCWLIISSVQWHLPEDDFHRGTSSGTNISFQITYLKFRSNFPGSNELIFQVRDSHMPHNRICSSLSLCPNVWWCQGISRHNKKSMICLCQSLLWLSLSQSNGIIQHDRRFVTWYPSTLIVKSLTVKAQPQWLKCISWLSNTTIIHIHNGISRYGFNNPYD